MLWSTGIEDIKSEVDERAGRDPEDGNERIKESPFFHAVLISFVAS